MSLTQGHLRRSSIKKNKKKLLRFFDYAVDKTWEYAREGRVSEEKEGLKRAKHTAAGHGRAARGFCFRKEPKVKVELWLRSCHSQYVSLISACLDLRRVSCVKDVQVNLDFWLSFQILVPHMTSLHIPGDEGQGPSFSLSSRTLNFGLLHWLHFQPRLEGTFSICYACCYKSRQTMVMVLKSSKWLCIDDRPQIRSY